MTYPHRRLLPLAAGALLASASFASASIITTITLGDDDCFGTNQVACDAGSTITAPTAGFDATGILPFPGIDNSTAGDPQGTDVFDELPPLSFGVLVSSGGMDITSVQISAKVWGLDLFATSPANGGTFGDAFEGARFQLNGTDIGAYFAPPGTGPNLIDIPVFDVDPALITDNAINTISILPETDYVQFAGAFFTGKDAFAVDYVRMRLTLDDAVVQPSVVPLPAGLPMLLAGLGVLGWTARRRSRLNA